MACNDCSRLNFTTGAHKANCTAELQCAVGRWGRDALLLGGATLSVAVAIGGYGLTSDKP